MEQKDKDYIYIGYQFGNVWGAFVNEEEADEWASEFPEDRTVETYARVTRK